MVTTYLKEPADYEEIKKLWLHKRALVIYRGKRISGIYEIVHISPSTRIPYYDEKTFKDKVKYSQPGLWLQRIDLEEDEKRLYNRDDVLIEGIDGQLFYEHLKTKPSREYITLQERLLEAQEIIKKLLEVITRMKLAEELNDEDKQEISYSLEDIPISNLNYPISGNKKLNKNLYWLYIHSNNISRVNRR